jgi:hypothetical protein
LSSGSDGNIVVRRALVGSEAATVEGATRVDASEVARQVNARIRELCARLDPERIEPVAFLCECGCVALPGTLAYVALTPAEYDALGGAPIYAQGHPVTRPSRR